MLDFLERNLTWQHIQEKLGRKEADNLNVLQSKAQTYINYKDKLYVDGQSRGLALLQKHL